MTLTGLPDGKPLQLQTNFRAAAVGAATFSTLPVSPKIGALSFNQDTVR